MRFESRTVGVFEVLAVHLEADQAFDAGRLRQETLRLVERGSRRIVLDLGSIDYLYSDSINAFVALNRRMLESSGRLGILVPHPKVHEILVRAGLENIMRLYRTEAELLGDSRELMRQSSAWTRPAELQNAASASQILSAANLTPRAQEAFRESAAGSQRIARRRQGSRVELKSRRRDGRRTDYPGDEPPLPPVLPSIGSESSSLRALSRESSTFGLHVPAPSDRKPVVPPSSPRPPSRPEAEPTVFQLPQDPEQDGYSTDAWLLALTNQSDELARRPAMEHDSSGFLPKLSQADSLSSPPTEAEPVSQLDTGLRWEEEIPLTDGPVSRPPSVHSTPSAHSAHSAHSVHEAPAAVRPPPFSPPAKAVPAPPPPAPAPAPPDALQQAIFHEPRHSPFTPPNSKAASSADDWFAQMGKQQVVAPPPAPTPAPAAQVPPRAPAPKPVSPPQQAPAPAAGSGSTSGANWFGQKPAQIQPAPAHAPSPPAAASPATPAENWFAHQSRPHVPPASQPAPVSHPAPVAPAPPAPKASADDWFAQPAPRSLTPASDRPAETDSWFGKNPGTAASPAASSGARPSPFTAPQSAPPSAAATAGASSGARPSVDWFKTAAPPPAPVRPPRTPKSEPAFLDSTEMELRGSRKQGAGLWVAIGLGVTLLLVGAGVWVVGNMKPQGEVPPGTSAVADSSGSNQGSTATTPAPASASDDEQSEAKPAETSKPSSSKKPVPVPVSKAKPASSTVPVPAKSVAPPPPPPPPPEEVHAPVKVFVTSRPSGASLQLDGKPVGTTPCEITVQRVGNLDFTLAGHRTLRKPVDPDELHGTINVQLLSDGGGGATGRIYIQSAPQGAEILFGGRSLGRTPKMVELPTGSQAVTVKSGVQSKTKTLDIQPGQNEAEHFSL